ncbi:MAG: tetratricopeptide repeat protein, partial [Coleofasciculus sp. S288]|nr:tetratricopeptide repeat protein [Coleofasciculus sp. S288]
MVIKPFGFFRQVRLRIKRSQARVRRLLTLLLLLALFSGAAVLPTLAHIAADTSIIQGSSNAEELVQQGRTLYEAERFNDAASVLQQAAEAFEVQGDGLRQAIALSNLSLAYQQLGQWEQAENVIAQSLNLLKTGQNLGTSSERLSEGDALRSQILAQSLDVQGRLQLAKGQAESALNSWRQAANIYAQVGDETGAIRSRINSASALQAMGLYRQAEQTLTEVNQTLQNQPDSLLKVTGLRHLGNVLRVVGDVSKSQQVLEQSLAVAQRLPSPTAIAEALLALGNTAHAQARTLLALGNTDGARTD